MKLGIACLFNNYLLFFISDISRTFMLSGPTYSKNRLKLTTSRNERLMLTFKVVVYIIL